MSNFQLLFSERHYYNKDSNITVPVVLYTDLTTRVQVRAKLDTGSDFCVFQPYQAAALGLELESGVMQRIRTAIGSFVAYGHEVTITVLNLEWQATVYFAEPSNFPVNVVGRIGFLDHIRMGLVDYDRVLYLADYNK